MDLIKTAIDYTKAEVFSAQFFILFGVLFAVASIGFWQVGKTELARAFIIPTLVVGLLLLAVGFGLFFTNRSRVANFSDAYNSDPNTFLQSELARAEKTVNDYQTIVFRAVPLIIIIAALSLMFLDRPIWRAISICTIALMSIILLVDNNAKARMEAYQGELMEISGESGD